MHIFFLCSIFLYSITFLYYLYYYVRFYIDFLMRFHFFLQFNQINRVFSTCDFLVTQNDGKNIWKYTITWNKTNFYYEKRACFRLYFQLVNKTVEGFKLEMEQPPYNRPCFLCHYFKVMVDNFSSMLWLVSF